MQLSRNLFAVVTKFLFGTKAYFVDKDGVSSSTSLTGEILDPRLLRLDDVFPDSIVYRGLEIDVHENGLVSSLFAGTEVLSGRVYFDGSGFFFAGEFNPPPSIKKFAFAWAGCVLLFAVLSVFLLLSLLSDGSIDNQQFLFRLCVFLFVSVGLILFGRLIMDLRALIKRPNRSYVLKKISVALRRAQPV